jgi:anthranilate/para-aminobenzoate synthase component II
MSHRYELTIDVFSNDDISIEQVRELAPAYILISPGPKATHKGTCTRGKNSAEDDQFKHELIRSKKDDADYWRAGGLKAEAPMSP